MEILIHRAEFVPGESVPLFELKPPVFEGFDYLLKRTFDVAGATLLLLALSPVLLVSALLVRVTSRGPVLYHSIRPGLGGVPFACFKFRTMYHGADLQQAELEALNEAGGAIFKIRRDPRVTPVGRFLRRYSIDELPQLMNVLRGEMSLVGPRAPGLPLSRALVGVPGPDHPAEDDPRRVPAAWRVLSRAARRSAADRVGPGGGHRDPHLRHLGRGRLRRPGRR